MQSVDNTPPQSWGTGRESGLDPGRSQWAKVNNASTTRWIGSRVILVSDIHKKPTCCRGRISLLSRLLSGSVILEAVISFSNANTEILYGVTQSLMPNTLAWTTPFVIMGLKYKLSCTLAIFKAFTSILTCARSAFNRGILTTVGSCTSQRRWLAS